ncbi:hypothetical protein MXB_2463 [Myxobolus squamalis]|nr:hypothetical protein MXB_2463 [Myxobolus squamalis]
MEVIRLSGYTSEEKQEIVKNYIIPSMIKTFNIGDIYGTNITISDEVINRLTDEYFLEAGVRKSKNCVEKICRKALKEIEMGDSSQVHVNLENITDYAGYPDQPIRRPVDNGICGLITGLSASEGYSTGFTLDIECEFASSNKKNGQIESTGLAGKSLSESSIVAFSAAKKVLQQIDSKNKSLDENVTRIHFLEGGVKKDGPSAGVAIFCAVLSQALNVPVSRNLAMTGEITLKGNVMAVGGIREKLTAVLYELLIFRL